MGIFSCIRGIVFVVTFYVITEVSNGVEQVIVLPNTDLLRKASEEKVVLVRASSAVGPKIYPVSLLIDIDPSTGKLTGITASYAEKLSLQQLVAAIDNVHKQWRRDAKGFSQFGLAIWRNPQDGYAIQAAYENSETKGPRMTILWSERPADSGASGSKNKK